MHLMFSLLAYLLIDSYEIHSLVLTKQKSPIITDGALPSGLLPGVVNVLNSKMWFSNLHRNQLNIDGTQGPSLTCFHPPQTHIQTPLHTCTRTFLHINPLI